MGKIVDKLDTDGVYMIVLREEQEVGILLLPVADEDAEESEKNKETNEAKKAEDNSLFDNL